MASLSALSIALLALSQAPAPVRMGTHGMVLFGGGNAPLYASHVPMFHAPHDLQLVLQLLVKHPTWKAPASFSDTGYTLVPERLDLTELAVGKRTAFKAAVFRGNFEAGGVELVKDADVTVQTVVLARALSTSAAPVAKLMYLWLPGGFLLHAISGPPDFDQVLKISPTAGTNVTTVTIERRPNNGDHRLLEREAVPFAGATVTVERELSFLVGPDFVVPERR